MRTYYQKYTPTKWRKFKTLQKKVMRKHGEHNLGTVNLFGSNNTAAKRYARRLGLLMGLKVKGAEVEKTGGFSLAMENPRTGELRSIDYTPCDWHDALVTVYCE